LWGLSSVQGGIALTLVLLGTLTTRKGFETMVDYTAPVLVLFLLTGVSLLVLRMRGAKIFRPFLVPF